jgi:hypothetical protein
VRKRVPGLLRGKIRISEDFDSPLPDDIFASFEFPENDMP